MNCRIAHCFVIVILLMSAVAHGTESALDATKRIAGKYTGQWSMFAFNDGKVVERAACTDVLIASHVTEDNERAYVEVIDVMTFPDGSTRTSKFIEGYYANSDGSAGDRFYEIQGKITIFKKLSENDWAYYAQPETGELWFLGFNPKDVISSSHIATKTTTYEDKIDTDHVTRVTTVQWKDANGTTQTSQFISLKGQHRRVAE